MQAGDSNETIKLLMNHRSIRRYKNEPVTGEQLDAVLACARQASSSSHMQAYSVIGITDPELRNQIADVAGNQRHVREAPVFLVWCADLSRFGEAVAMHGGSFDATTEYFLVATVDASLAAQNAAAAAESLGLGIVYIGGIRNDMRKMSELLRLPPLVYPVFGMCIGVPDEQPDHRPRLPMESMYAENRYRENGYAEDLDRYDSLYAEYIRNRSGGGRESSWTREMKGRTDYPSRSYADFLREQGFSFED
ncbi:oxygen-insensitive NADPH nitroreductase [Paenibacillus sp. D51F]